MDQAIPELGQAGGGGPPGPAAPPSPGEPAATTGEQGPSGGGGPSSATPAGRSAPGQPSGWGPGGASGGERAAGDDADLPENEQVSDALLTACGQSPKNFHVDPQRHLVRYILGMKVGDVFGCGDDDVYILGLVAFWVLQHNDGYPPFVNYVFVEHEVVFRYYAADV